MKASELRIGNLVKVHGDNEKVTPGYISSFNYLRIEPIPLTEQRLIDFGFEKTKLSRINIFRIKGFRDFKVVQEEGRFIIEYYGLSIEKKHVHQFQNLYFALTGEELTIKERA